MNYTLWVTLPDHVIPKRKRRFIEVEIEDTNIIRAAVTIIDKKLTELIAERSELQQKADFLARKKRMQDEFWFVFP